MCIGVARMHVHRAGEAGVILFWTREPIGRALGHRMWLVDVDKVLLGVGGILVDDGNPKGVVVVL